MATVTSELLQSLRISFGANFNQAFKGARSRYKDIAMVAHSSSSKSVYGWLGQMPQLREWLGERHIQSLQSYGFEIENRDFEMTIEVRRNDIMDDNAGVYGPLFNEMGRAAALHPDELIFGLLPDGFTAPCYDGQNFFDTDHPVRDADGNDTVASNMQDGAQTPWYLLDTSRAIRPLIYQERMPYKMVHKDQPNDDNVFFQKTMIYGVDGRSNAGYGLWQFAFGSKLTLDPDSYVAAKIAMTSLRGDNGRLLGIRPTTCVVPPSLEMDAKELFKKTHLSNGESNVLYDDVEIIVADWLA